MAAAPKQVTETEEKCPDPNNVHGGEPPNLVIRWGRRGQFLGCPSFPECNFTKALDGEESSEPEQTDEPCPECGTPMVIRSGRFGKFMACSRYPECKGRKPLNKPSGVKCPKTGGDLVERRTRRGRTFYGCTDYPKCDFTTWTKPFPQPCPNCGKLIVADKDNTAKCTECDWRGPAPTAAPEPAQVGS